MVYFKGILGRKKPPKYVCPAQTLIQTGLVFSCCAEHSPLLGVASRTCWCLYTSAGVVIPVFALCVLFTLLKGQRLHCGIKLCSCISTSLF